MTAPRLLRLGGPLSLVVAIAVVVGWFPASRAEDSARQRIDSADRLVEDLRWELDEVDAIEGSDASLLQTLATLTTQVPDDHDLAETVISLQAMTDGVGIDLLDVVPASVYGSVDDLRTPVGSSSIVLAVGLRTGFVELVAFLDRLDDEPRLHVVDGVAVGVDEATGRLAVDMEIRVYTTRQLIVADDDFLEDDLEDQAFEEEDF